MQTLVITRPDDWHVHFRDGDALKETVAATARHFSRALAMPNLKPALTSVRSVLAYRERLMKALTSPYDFTPYMTLYINEQVQPEEMLSIQAGDAILGAKLYPAGATTNSEEGTHSLRALYPLLEVMQQQDLVLQIHGEITHGDIFDREAAFLTEGLLPLTRDFPKLRIVLEHISTKAAVDFVSEAGERVAATITPHHLLYNRNQLLSGGVKPHYYCLPILKRERDQLALQQAAVSGNAKFFAGTDSAPHARQNKETACGCAGIYSAPYAVSLYAQVFDQLGKLEKLNCFMGHFGASFYQLPINKSELLLKRQPQTVPHSLPLGKDSVIPMAAGETLAWSVHEG
ncbi:dihydroorotase, homodimeric type [Legionella rubrilucens]|uniref:Dihydroorotase n=1 Tax=Legionella rubrilucens TaxID=458 RepID=A0A0W0XMH5_9GAMM|nr:dihydroorotase [Legionella rubrilucens]KTD45784.1 dihydroorotase, homodimeric type [Legionella rubrilucens]